MDLTALDEDDDAEVAEALRTWAQTPEGPVAAVCLMPAFVALARERLAGTRVRVATVANFSAGPADLGGAARETANTASAGRTRSTSSPVGARGSPSRTPSRRT